MNPLYLLRQFFQPGRNPHGGMMNPQTGLYFVPDTPDNRAKLAGISKPKVETPLS